MRYLPPPGGTPTSYPHFLEVPPLDHDQVLALVRQLPEERKNWLLPPQRSRRHIRQPLAHGNNGIETFYRQGFQSELIDRALDKLLEQEEERAERATLDLPYVDAPDEQIPIAGSTVRIAVVYLTPNHYPAEDGPLDLAALAEQAMLHRDLILARTLPL